MKNLLSKSIKSFLVFSLIILSSCTSKLGDFSVISTQNVRGLEYGGKYRDEIKSVNEKSCTHRIYLTRTAAGLFLIFPWFMPVFDIVLGDSEDDRLELAVDKAVRAGKNSGVFDGDMLVNSVIKEKNVIIPLIYGYKCIIAEGEVVSSTTRTEGFLEKKKRD